MSVLTTRQKHILKIVNSFREGWIGEEELEKRLEKLFTDKRHRPKKK
jgi:hypothetical protein